MNSSTSKPEYRFSYRGYAESVPLGQKPQVYSELIEKEKEIHKAKEFQRGGWKIVYSIDCQTPIEERLEKY